MAITITKSVDTVTTRFNFRNKFVEKVLTDENRQAITAAFELFCRFYPDRAIEALWKLTYKPDQAPRIWERIELSPEAIPAENVSIFVNELRHQYEQLHPNFLEVDVPEECQEAFQSLCNVVGPVAANVVYDRCAIALCNDKDYISRALNCLGDSKENRYFGGLCQLCLGKLESNYLKPHHKQIYNLFKAMVDFQSQRQNEQVQQESGELPFTFEPNTSAKEEAPVEVHDDVSNVSEDTPTIDPVQANSEFKELTPENILEHRDAFASFVQDDNMNILLQIGNLGFDLNKVLPKKEAISNLLAAVELKEKADACLLEATKALS